MAVDEAVVRSELLALREAAGERRALLVSDRRSVLDAAADVATDDEHDPEGATIAYERSRLGALIAQADEQAADVQAALARLDDGTYGRCERCGAEIAAARLEALPATRTCLTCAAASRR